MSGVGACPPGLYLLLRGGRAHLLRALHRTGAKRPWPCTRWPPTAAMILAPAHCRVAFRGAHLAGRVLALIGGLSLAGVGPDICPPGQGRRGAGHRPQPRGHGANCCACPRCGSWWYSFRLGHREPAWESTPCCPYTLVTEKGFDQELGQPHAGRLSGAGARPGLWRGLGPRPLRGQGQPGYHFCGHRPGHV